MEHVQGNNVRDWSDFSASALKVFPGLFFRIFLIFLIFLISYSIP